MCMSHQGHLSRHRRSRRVCSISVPENHTKRSAGGGHSSTTSSTPHHGSKTTTRMVSAWTQAVPPLRSCGEQVERGGPCTREGARRVVHASRVPLGCNQPLPLAGAVRSEGQKVSSAFPWQHQPVITAMSQGTGLRAGGPWPCRTRRSQPAALLSGHSSAGIRKDSQNKWKINGVAGNPGCADTELVRGWAGGSGCP